MHSWRSRSDQVSTKFACLTLLFSLAGNKNHRSVIIRSRPPQQPVVQRPQPIFNPVVPLENYFDAAQLAPMGEVVAANAPIRVFHFDYPARPHMNMPDPHQIQMANQSEVNARYRQVVPRRSQRQDAADRALEEDDSDHPGLADDSQTHRESLADSGVDEDDLPRNRQLLNLDAVT